MESFFDENVPLGHRELISATRKLRRQFPELAVFSVGRSVLGRSIPGYIIGCGRPAALYVGGVHALEYITSMLLVKFTGDLCQLAQDQGSAAGYDIAHLLADRSVYILPMLNPDGVELHLRGVDTAGPLRAGLLRISGGDFLHWQANAHGVDINHNFNAGYAIVKQEERANGITGPAPGRYGGTRPESEPETRALCSLCRRTFFGKAFAFHSQGEEIYWQYGPRTPRCAREMAETLAAASGYTVAQPTGMAANGGFKDWFIHVFARPGFTIEVGRGVNPLPVFEFGGIYEKLSDALVTGLFM